MKLVYFECFYGTLALDPGRIIGFRRNQDSLDFPTAILTDVPDEYMLVRNSFDDVTAKLMAVQDHSDRKPNGPFPSLREEDVIALRSKYGWAKETIRTVEAAIVAMIEARKR